ncbi:MAG: ribosome-associated translation inhibitor RaiA [Kiritimatiellaeota bacterium]|nr:ribosome-associated translation inhibitor RaiA [Kiritimatiellota bacterium]
MSIIVSGRSEFVNDAMKEQAESKVREIIEGRNKISSAKIILDIEKNRQKVEILIQGKHLTIEADYESYDMFESIDKAVAKADRQLEKYFDKKQDHHKHSHNISKAAPTENEDESDLDFDEDME